MVSSPSVFPGSRRSVCSLAHYSFPDIICGFLSTLSYLFLSGFLLNVSMCLSLCGHPVWGSLILNMDTDIFHQFFLKVLAVVSLDIFLSPPPFFFLALPLCPDASSSESLFTFFLFCVLQTALSDKMCREYLFQWLYV